MIGVSIHVVSVLALLVASIVGRMVIVRNPTPVVIRNTSQLVLIILNLSIFLGYFVVLLVPGLAAVNRATGLDTIPLPRALEIVLGTALVGAGCCVYYMTVSQLMNRGKGFSAYKFTENVVTDSIYRHVKNPMSVGYYLFALGVPFLTDSAYYLVVTILGFIPVQLLYVLIYEEKELELRFGVGYRDYAAGVPRFIPRFSKAVSHHE